MTTKPTQRYGAKIILIAFVVLVAMVLFASTAIGAPDYVAGDVNGDGKIDVRDVVMVQKHILGLQFPPLTAVQLLAADVNGDGDINISDAVIIMQMSLGIIESYPMPILSINDAIVRVPIYTALADINLPTTVEANFAGGLKRNISVRWERVSSPAYNPFVFDEYIFKGDLINLPLGVRNPASLRTTARVSFLLRDPWPFPGPDTGDFLFLQVNPFGAGTVSGAGNYSAGTTVNLTASPNSGYQFVNWTRGGVVLSTSPNFNFTMPDASTVLVANFTGGEWPIELEGTPLIGGGDFGVYVVTLTMKDQVAADVTAVTVKGVTANKNPSNSKQWRAVFTSPVTLNDLRGQIVITHTTTPPGSVNIIDIGNSSAIEVGIFDATSVWVAIRAGQTANTVTANGVQLNYNAVGNRWEGILYGLNPGNLVTINASNITGTDSKTLIVQEVN